MTSEQKIPDDLRDALDQAAGLLDDWKWGGPEPDASYKSGPVKISKIFELVTAFSDRATETEYRVVRTIAQTIRSSNFAGGHPCDDPDDDTYASIAKCYLGLLAAVTAHYGRR